MIGGVVGVVCVPGALREKLELMGNKPHFKSVSSRGLKIDNT